MLGKFDENLFILACQALPGLARRAGIECKLPEEISPPGISEKEEVMLTAERESVLTELFATGHITWRDIFEGSEIGRERTAIANLLPRGSSRILDVGCGRGYFTFACANLGKQVVGVDIMNGGLRRGWWRAFLASRTALGLEQQVHGTRADATILPFKPAFFDAVAGVHALRNLRTTKEIKPTLREMKRVLKPGGQALLAESVMEPASKAQEVYVSWYRLRTKLGWELQLPAPTELESWFEEVGFTDVSSEVQDFTLQYAPAAFRLTRDMDLAKWENLAGEYDEVWKSWKTFGEDGPPVQILVGRN